MPKVKESTEIQRLKEQFTATVNNLQKQVEEISLSESYTGLDWANRIDRDFLWIRASGANAPQFRYMTKETIDLYNDQANFLWVYSPLVQRIVQVKTQFTFALDYSITPLSDNLNIDAIRKDPLNDQAFFCHQAITEIDGELQRSGNVFIALWKDNKQVRAWPSYEIRDIVQDSEDTARPLFYIRQWLDASGKEYRRAYPSIYAKPEEVPDGKTKLKYLGNEYEVDQKTVVYHLSAVKGLKEKFARSELISVCRWVKPYEQFLEDFAAIVSGMRKITHMMITKGGSAQISALAGQLAGDTNNMGTPLQSKPAGSIMVAQEGNELRVIDAGSGKIIGLSDSRTLLMMICAASGVPETYLTMDPSTGNLATAKEISPIFVMLIQERQTAWKNTLIQIFKTLLESDQFEVSFPPIRDNINAYVDNVNKFAYDNAGNWKGTFQPKDYIKAAHEVLEWKMPDDATLDVMAADMIEKTSQIPEPPGFGSGLDNIADATRHLTAAANKKP